MQATQNLPNILTAECADAKDSSTPFHVCDCFVKMKCVYCDEHSFHRAMGWGVEIIKFFLNERQTFELKHKFTHLWMENTPFHERRGSNYKSHSSFCSVLSAFEDLFSIWGMLSTTSDVIDILIYLILVICERCHPRRASVTQFCPFQPPSMWRKISFFKSNHAINWQLMSFLKSTQSCSISVCHRQPLDWI